MKTNSRGEIRPGLSRVSALLHLLDDPQENLKLIHVAGTNGKGSACAMLEAILRAAGYRTGLYTSPHLMRVNEEIRVHGREIPDEQLNPLLRRVLSQAERMADPPTRFEIMTAASLLYFHECRCEIVILEAGMGGTQDATNVIPAPEACVIMNIGLDHTEYLGTTEEEITEQKAGIMKPGSQVICYDLPENLRSVIDRTGEESGAVIRYADFSSLRVRQLPEGQEPFGGKGAGRLPGLCEPAAGPSVSQVLCYRGKSYAFSMSGSYQGKNAAVVLETVGALRERGWRISEEDTACGLLNVKWPARFEIMSRDPLLVIDGGHNPQCAQAFSGSLLQLNGDGKWLIVLGMLRDKDTEAVIDLLRPAASSFFCVAPESERALPAEELCEKVRRKGLKARSCGSVAEALNAAFSEARRCRMSAAVFGSLYLAGPARAYFKSVLS